MDFSNLSIKNYIGDLPRIINENFKSIGDKLDSLFVKTVDHNDIYAKNATIAGTLDANTITANNDVKIVIDGETVSVANVIKQLKDSGIID